MSKVGNCTDSKLEQSRELEKSKSLYDYSKVEN